MRRLNTVRSGEMVMLTPMFYHNIRGKVVDLLFIVWRYLYLLELD